MTFESRAAAVKSVSVNEPRRAREVASPRHAMLVEIEIFIIESNPSPRSARGEKEKRKKRRPNENGKLITGI